MALAQPHVEPRDHAVLFYRRDDELYEKVGRFLTDALAAGGIAIVAATPERTRAFDAAMGSLGVPVSQMRSTGRLLSIDAEEVASSMATGDLTGERFDSLVGTTVREAVQSGRDVSVYGEIVAVLWDRGHVVPALDLESRWNELRDEMPFALLCAYHTGSIAREEHGPALDRLCRLHSSVNGHLEAVDGRDPALAEATHRFERSVHAPREARHFVADTLEAWRCPTLVDDASLIVTELATNAVVHAQTDFIVTLTRSRRGVRISVEDSSFVAPTVAMAPRSATSGRGLTLVAAVANRWGDGSVGSGKVVWAELSDEGSADRAPVP
jgi:anti-sigma regulatory factor (Ser/Thr protein kinase)